MAALLLLPFGQPVAADGIAAGYPGDQGIEADSRVLFTEMFDEATVAALLQRWNDSSGSAIFSFSGDLPSGSSGSRSLLMTHVGGQGTGGYLYRKLLPGYNRLFLRFYVKFDPSCAYVRHFAWLGGYNPASDWPLGGAGQRPTGSDRFTSGVEPMRNAWRWDFYTYWMGMHADGTSYWGNDFINDSSFGVARGEWICIEFMLLMNSPTTASNGEQAMWINGQPWHSGGQLVSHLGPGFPNGNWSGDSFYPNAAGPPFEGFQWRNTESLKINFVWLQLYITDAATGHTSRVWFDHLVVATDYIGPIAQTSSMSPVQSLAADPIRANAVTLTWANPADSRFIGTRIRYSTTGFLQGPDDGLPVCDRTAAPGSTDTFEHLGLSANTRLYYSAFAYAAGGLFAAPLQLEVTTRPDRPENLRVIDK